MLTTKNINYGGAIAVLVLAVFLSGCGPPGPRALLKGRKYLERGNYSEAVEEFKRATSLMSTNAQAWNYLGVADQHAGRPADAVLAYQRALMLDRDLMEAHFNLGCLWLEQDRPDVARTEFMAYVLRRSKAPEGWTKLGVAQLRLRDLTAAEKSFSTALSIDPKDAEALNGLGLAQMQRGRPREAAQHFLAATRAQPDYAPALLNLATVERQYLHDNALALQNYRAYLALTPRRADWDQVNAIANDLEQQINGTPKPSQPGRPAVSAATPAGRKAPPVAQTQAPPRPAPPRRNLSKASPPPEVAERENPSAPEASPSTPAETAPRPANEGSGTLHEMNPLNWFRSASPKPTVAKMSPTNSTGNEVQPALESRTNPLTSVVPVQRRPIQPFHLVQPAPPSFPRYLYLSPPRPVAGDRRAATRAFAQAQQFEQSKRYSDALDSYRAAAQLDPGWFEAQYNCGVMAYRLKHFTQSLHAYEMALSIQPDSEPARYNFALVLKEAGYVPDAVSELKKILASYPNDVRAHLALGNLCAQQLYDFTAARAQYLEVLRLDPANPQAADIQFWLSANPP